jgi:predicted short-subunit dehydrogenase-like oxidoreductase (DUF2520 family)
MSESPFLKIALAGAGNVATHLGLALKHAGFSIESVLNRSSEQGLILAEKLDAQFTTSIEALGNPDLLIVAVSDDAIPALAGQLSGCTFPVVHTSGTVSKAVLSVVGPDYGVFYPLQTFSMGHYVDFSKVPICIDSSNPNFTKKLDILAHSLSESVYQIGDQQRKILHLAGVFACNFSNYLYTVAAGILENNEIPFELLLPLIQETAVKIQTTAPIDAQTGPAKRGDVSTIQQHLLMLQNEPELLDIYKLLTDNILIAYSHHFSTSHFLSKDEKQ